MIQIIFQNKRIGKDNMLKFGLTKLFYIIKFVRIRKTAATYESTTEINHNAKKTIGKCINVI